LEVRWQSPRRNSVSPARCSHVRKRSWVFFTPVRSSSPLGGSLVL
jgi:hypothetical protein